MKDKKVIAVLIFGLLSLGVSIWALVIAHANYSGLVFDFGKMGDLVGLLITVTGVIFTLYFVIIGIDASDKSKKIEKTKVEVDAIAKAVAQQQNTVNNNITLMNEKLSRADNEISSKKDIIGVIEESIKQKQNEIINDINETSTRLNEINRAIAEKQFQINQTRTIVNESERERTIKILRRDRARLSTQSNFLSKEKRLQRIPDLNELGDRDDVKDLERIIQDPTEDGDIIVLAKSVKEYIESRI